jgi:hypothetical protein
MLLLEDRRFYCYIYLNPLKPGNYNYGEYHFDFEPFYIGKGNGRRMYDHLLEAKSISQNKKCIRNYNKHKINTINKIIRVSNSIPLIMKVRGNLTTFEATEFEKTLVCLIGRRDLQTGPLTNLTDGGEGNINPSVVSTEKRKRSRRLTLEKNPEIGIQISLRIIAYYQNRTIEQKELWYRHFSESIKKNPEIKKQSTLKRLKTEQARGSRKQATLKCKETKAKNPQINVEGGKKISKYWKDHPDEQKMRDYKNSETRTKRKIAMGTKNIQYVEANIIYIVEAFFKGVTLSGILNNYMPLKSEKLSYGVLHRIFHIFSFPSQIKSNGFFTKKYLAFIQENKHKHQWYIDNYKRLEQEYFDKKFAERHPEYVESNVS